MKKQLQEDLENFNIAEFLKTFKCNKLLNVKQAIYRSVTLFVSALGQLHHCFGNYSNFEILENLRHKHVIDDTTYHDLSFAIAVACHVRLYQYMRMNAQNDSVTEYSENFFRSDKLNFFLTVVSKEEFIKFFSTVLRLQMLLADDKVFDINKKFQENIWPKLAVKMFMALYDEVINDGERYLHGRVNLNDEDFNVLEYITSACLRIFLRNFSNAVRDAKDLFSLKCCELNPIFVSEGSKSPKQVLTQDMRLKNFDGLVKFGNVLARLEYSPKNALDEYCFLFMAKGFALAETQRYHEALSSLRDHLRTSKLIWANCSLEFILFRVVVSQNISVCLLQTGKPEKGLHCAFECLELFYQHGNIIQLQWQIFDVIAKSYLKLNLTHQEKRYREKAKISRNTLILKDFVPMIAVMKCLISEINANFFKL